MYRQRQKAKKMKRKQRRIREASSRSTKSSPSNNTHTIIILASLANVHHNNFARTLLTKHLYHLHQSLNNSSKTLTLIDNNLFYSLLPPLLRITNSAARRTSEIIGAIALQSLESNQRIASDQDILRALLDAITSRSSKRVAMAACNAVMDLSTTSVGREKLCELNAVAKLMSVFLQDAILPAKYAFLCSTREGNSNCRRGGIIADSFRVLVLDAIVTLVNTCNLKQLVEIPVELSEIISSYLKALLVQVRDQSSQRDIAKCSKEGNSCLSIAKMQDLTESIFRLSINSGHFTTTHVSDEVKRSIFGPNKSDFEHFMFNYWENSPVLLRKLLDPLDDHHDILSSFVQSFNSKRINDILPSILEGLVCCPPLPSDELDILNFLKEMKDGLGYPIIYGHDIRVVKAVEGILGTIQGNLKQEVHFLKDCTGSSCISGPDLINIVDVQKCEEAYREGYTIALRGLEFRSENIASIANELAVLFGQPSVGANTYLTPPRSQGLARHYDDHCVFVCQLHGKKQWTIFPRSTLHLPRLYEPLDGVVSSEGDIPEHIGKQFLLGEGDILYIPRGCPHEACTIADDGGSEMDGESTGFSFHLTLGIEIEPPFEWEGFAHVALHCWNQNKNQPLSAPVGPFSKTMNFMSINLLHVAIHQIGADDPTFAKACMVVAFFSSSETQDKHQSNTLLQSLRTTFSYMVNKIDREAGFLEAVKSVDVAVREKNEDMFHRMRWLRHLYPDGDTKEGLDWDNPLTEFENIFLFFNEHREDAEETFMQWKSKFCREVVFEDVYESFEILLHKYKRVRTQYMNGMLSLHCNGN